MRRLGPTVVATAVALALPAAAGAQQRTISVGGQATLTARNDTARVGFGVTSERRTRRAALNASSRRTRKVIAALRAAGIQARDIRTGTITVTTIRRRARPRRVRRYRVRQSVAARVRDARRAGNIVSTGVDAGATSVSGPEFFIADERALFRRAVGAAFDDARATAAVLARQAGLTLGRALAIRESSFSDAGGTKEQASAPNEVQAEGAPVPAPTSPGNTTVEASVDVVFEAR